MMAELHFYSLPVDKIEWWTWFADSATKALGSCMAESRKTIRQLVRTKFILFNFSDVEM
jgi:hypothetical protein